LASVVVGEAASRHDADALWGAPGSTPGPRAALRKTKRVSFHRVTPTTHDGPTGCPRPGGDDGIWRRDIGRGSPPPRIVPARGVAGAHPGRRLTALGRSALRPGVLCRRCTVAWGFRARRASPDPTDVRRTSSGAVITTRSWPTRMCRGFCNDSCHFRWCPRVFSYP
jgi:hypothetical protein